MVIYFVSLTFVGYMVVLTCIVLLVGYELLVVNENQTNSLVAPHDIPSITFLYCTGLL
jgi:hypothetical protein